VTSSTQSYVTRRLTDGAETEETRYRILKVSAVTWGEYQPQESKPVPSDYEPLEHHFVRKGDLLFSRANTTALVGATVYVFDTPENIVLSDKLWRFVWHEPQLIDPLYVWALFLNQSIRRELGSRATGTGGSMKNISKPKVLSMHVPLPPLSLQREFAARVVEARALQDQQARSRVRLEAGFQALLHQAFNGKL
jgi:type I restriction enzyme, S subunit